METDPRIMTNDVWLCREMESWQAAKCLAPISISQPLL